MSDTGSANPPPKIGTSEVYKRLLETRDFELTTFWQRSIFLGTFLSLSYTGYGALGLKLLEAKGGEAIWQVGNLFAIVIACFGIIVSALWILMAKGSKLWYEWQETAIVAFTHDLAPDSAFDKSVREMVAFKIGWTAEFDNRWREIKKDKFLFSPNGGPFSVSKVTICIGQFSLMGWILVGAFHLMVLAIGCQAEFGKFLSTRGMTIGGGALLGVTVFFVFFVLRRYVGSSILSKKM